MIQRSLPSLIAWNRPDLTPYEDLYKHLHSHPELSPWEKQAVCIHTVHVE